MVIKTEFIFKNIEEEKILKKFAEKRGITPEEAAIIKLARQIQDKYDENGW